ncbi:hypothetical protein [Helicobacter didelphidarum]|uniref:hypothetical protein n=1 Tax=Helicobacter didelphidarum TaxID=2040648 RepID=UPI0011C022D4|nr:hypothetical protein [Helicobacter didelphidarum]
MRDRFSRRSESARRWEEVRKLLTIFSQNERFVEFVGSLTIEIENYKRFVEKDSSYEDYTQSKYNFTLHKSSTML